jgi:hypothetical protein
LLQPLLADCQKLGLGAFYVSSLLLRRQRLCKSCADLNSVPPACDRLQPDPAGQSAQAGDGGWMNSWCQRCAQAAVFRDPQRGQTPQFVRSEPGEHRKGAGSERDQFSGVENVGVQAVFPQTLKGRFVPWPLAIQHCWGSQRLVHLLL